MQPTTSPTLSSVPSSLTGLGHPGEGRHVGGSRGVPGHRTRSVSSAASAAAPWNRPSGPAPSAHRPAPGRTPGVDHRVHLCPVWRWVCGGVVRENRTSPDSNIPHRRKDPPSASLEPCSWPVPGQLGARHPVDLGARWARPAGGRPRAAPAPGGAVWWGSAASRWSSTGKPQTL